jgi:hypothetical protein
LFCHRLSISGSTATPFFPSKSFKYILITLVSHFFSADLIFTIFAYLTNIAGFLTGTTPQILSWYVYGLVLAAYNGDPAACSEVYGTEAVREWMCTIDNLDV